MTRTEIKAFKDELNADRIRIEDIYRETRDCSVSDSVDWMIYYLGLDRVREIIASLIYVNSWDGRISRSNSIWAEYYYSELISRHIHSSIHLANLNQIASYLATF